jgi:hypothetical protein
MRLVTVGVALCMIVGGCGFGSSHNAAAPAKILRPSDTSPSSTAIMVCAREAVEEIASTIYTKTVEPVRPTWNGDLYACRFVYAHGAVMGMSVKELRSKAATAAYFNELARKLGKVHDVLIVGQHAFTTRNGSLVVRKDDKVLLVDVTKLPRHFARQSRGQVAKLVAEVIMDCWKGF